MRKLICFLIICGIISVRTASPYDKDKMHISINREALERFNTNNNLNDYGFSNGIDTYLNGDSITDIIGRGGREEDNPEIIRPLKHFHDPTQSWDKTTDNAELTWTPTSMSSVRWAQNQRLFSLGGDWDWESARDNLYKALTSMNESKREKYFAEAFEALGHIMHLIADMSSPPHVRNDRHPGSGNYETYCKNNVDKKIVFSGANPITGSIFQTSLVTGMEPITNLWDTDNSPGYNPAIGSNSPNVGLAEYTNFNFFSKDTVFDPRYTYPSTSMAAQGVIIQDPGSGDERYYFSGETSDEIPVTHYAKMDYFYTDLTTALEKSKISLDEKCYEDYANILVPKAVSYGTALLDYFFRGKLDADAVYFGKDSNGDINAVTVKIKNLSNIDPTDPNLGEDMVDGNLTLMYRYKLLATDPDYIYGRASNILTNVSLAYDLDELNPVFDFPNPIPCDAEVREYTLVYRGKLGDEEDAVAAKIFGQSAPCCYLGNWDDVTISEPPGGPPDETNLTIVNSTCGHSRWDMKCKYDLPGGGVYNICPSVDLSLLDVHATCNQLVFKINNVPDESWDDQIILAQKFPGAFYLMFSATSEPKQTMYSFMVRLQWESPPSDLFPIPDIYQLDLVFDPSDSYDTTEGCEQWENPLKRQCWVSGLEQGKNIVVNVPALFDRFELRGTAPRADGYYPNIIELWSSNLTGFPQDIRWGKICRIPDRPDPALFPHVYIE